MEDQFSVPVGWVAALLAAVAAGYPLIWAFFSKLVNGLLERQNTVTDAWQETAVAREDKHREELLSAIRELEDRRSSRAGEIEAGLREDLQAVHRRLDDIQAALRNRSDV